MKLYLYTCDDVPLVSTVSTINKISRTSGSPQSRILGLREVGRYKPVYILYNPCQRSFVPMQVIKRKREKRKSKESDDKRSRCSPNLNRYVGDESTI